MKLIKEQKIFVYADYKFLFCFYMDPFEHLFCHLAENAFNHIQPRAMFWRKYKLKPSFWHCRQESFCFL